MSPQQDDTSVVIARLRKVVSEGTTRPLAWRRAQLAAVDDLLRTHGAEICRALAADLGKSATESHVTELGVARAEFRHIQRNLRRWLASRLVGVPVHLWRSHTEPNLGPSGPHPHIQS